MRKTILFLAVTIMSLNMVSCGKTTPIAEEGKEIETSSNWVEENKDTILKEINAISNNTVTDIDVTSYRDNGNTIEIKVMCDTLVCYNVVYTKKTDKYVISSE